MSRLRFRGQIAGLGSDSGVRIVVGHWDDSPFGAFTDLMVEQADGWRVLIAPTRQVAAFVAGTYGFDEVEVGEVEWVRRGTEVSVTGPGLELSFLVGARTRLGRLLRLVPPRVATSPTWSRLIGPLSARLVPGVRTFGSAGSGRWEAYGATDLHAITRSAGVWRGRTLGELAPVEPPVAVGFASTPRIPGLTTLVTTVGSG
ncbi:MAG TPA: hypothetical protein VFU98_04815 [Microlunatus sp.]|nr:hypothetical protein [Microlunatus sp.]